MRYRQKIVVLEFYVLELITAMASGQRQFSYVAEKELKFEDLIEQTA